MTYLGVVLKKETVHWKRMKNLMKEFKGGAKIIGFIGAIVLTLVHYAYVLMHSSYECALYIFNRKQFKANLFKLKTTLVN